MTFQQGHFDLCAENRLYGLRKGLRVGKQLKCSEIAQAGDATLVYESGSNGGAQD